MILTQPKTGWIGVDIGSSTIKVVQLVRVKGRPEVAASAVIPRGMCWPPEAGPTSEPLPSIEELASARALEENFRGRRVAATLPMSVCDLDVLDGLSAESSGNMRHVVESIETLTGQSARQLSYALWPGAVPKDSSQQCRTNVIAVAHPWTDQVCEDVASHGWSCDVVDGLPFCLARAVVMSPGPDTSGPVAALDWGYRSATFCVVAEGRPVYVRCLKDAGFERLVDALTESLDIHGEEARQLVLEHGITDTTGRAATDLAQIVAELIAPTLDQLVGEIQRTLAHLDRQRSTPTPRQMLLFGGGATVKGLATYLESQLPLTARVWRLAGARSSAKEPSVAPSCLLGPAVALSALAWEKS
jgi:Tfp pilus assembly PilM family ATPase